MSQQIANISLVGAVVGQTGSIPATGILPTPPPTAIQQMRPDAGNLPVVVVFNESPCILMLTLPNSGQSLTLPAGRWVPIPIPATETQLHYTVQAVASGTPLFNNLLADYYNPGEPVEDLGVLGNSPIAGSVTTSNTYALYAPDNSEFFAANLASAGFQYLRLRPQTTSGLGPLGSALSYLAAAGGFADGLIVTQNGFVEIPNTIVSLGGEAAAAGALGVPVVDGLTVAQHVTGTGATTILNFTPATTGLYRLSAYARINNAITPNAVHMVLSWNDPDAGGFTSINAFSSTAGSFMNGTNNMANSGHSIIPITFRHTGGQAITVTYTDPTNTPNDFVSVFVERIA